MLDAALAQLPADVADREREEPVEILARADSAGATHDFAVALRARKIRFSLGYYRTETVSQAALALPASAGGPPSTQTAKRARAAWVAELTDAVELRAWPEGSRLIVRRERPHPGAQLRFTDPDGHRYQCFLGDQQGEDIAALDLRHRQHARAASGCARRGRRSARS